MTRSHFCSVVLLLDLHRVSVSMRLRSDCLCVFVFVCLCSDYSMVSLPVSTFFIHNPDLLLVGAWPLRVATLLLLVNRYYFRRVELHTQKIKAIESLLKREDQHST